MTATSGVGPSLDPMALHRETMMLDAADPYLLVSPIA
jgi:hypothetical protein